MNRRHGEDGVKERLLSAKTRSAEASALVETAAGSARTIWGATRAAAKSWRNMVKLAKGEGGVPVRGSYAAERWMHAKQWQ